jgi:hypothetical protein
MGKKLVPYESVAKRNRAFREKNSFEKVIDILKSFC